MKIIIFTVLGFFLVNTTIAQGEYGSWAPNPACFKGFSVRVKNKGLVKSINKYEYHAQVRNDYTKRVHFDMTWSVAGEEQNIGRFSLNPGGITNAVTYYFNANINGMNVGITNVCFGENWLSCSSNGTSGICFADCDNGTPNIPANCGGNTGNAKTNTTKSSSTTTSITSSPSQTSPSRPSSTGSSNQTSTYIPPEPPRQSVALTLLQDQQLVNQTVTALGDLFDNIKKRKEDKIKQKRMLEKEKDKEAETSETAGYDLVFNTTEFDAYCQYLLNEITERSSLIFKKFNYYSLWSNTTNSRKVLSLDLGDAGLYFTYGYAGIYGNSTQVKLERYLNLSFKNKKLFNELLSSDAFAFLKKNCRYISIEKDYNEISFFDLSFEGNSEYLKVASQLKNNSYPINITPMLDSVVAEANRPIDTSKNILEELRRKGDIYNAGAGLLQDQEIAIEYFKKAWELGDAKSAIRLGNLYKNYPYQNTAKAREYFDAAWAKSEPTAAKEIGYMYQYGQGGYLKDLDKAEEWYEKGVTLGDAGSMYCLYELYENSETKKDHKKAMKWLEKSCQYSKPGSYYCKKFEEKR